MELHWHPYRYFPYEHELGIREVKALLSPKNIVESKDKILIKSPKNINAIDRLVYFAEMNNDGQLLSTLQAKLERVNGNGTNRQSTRYSAHGLHEYKGKFNPQICRVILNILNIPIGSRVLDPFCGSGTSLVECAHIGMNATGIDINPLAIFIANAKLLALRIPVHRLRDALKNTIKLHRTVKLPHMEADDQRISYLEKWFDLESLHEIEKLRKTLLRLDQDCASVLLSIASNILRDYSLQDPNDLRIRRRKTPPPQKTFFDAFKEAANLFFMRLEASQAIIKEHPVQGKALLIDNKTMKLGQDGIDQLKFDCAVTSPPYATALPYIDTQRLSLVWLELLLPSEILPLEAALIGSREIRGKSKKTLISAFDENRHGLPKNQIKYCQMLKNNLSNEDGFRRQAVPKLLYRYFSDMAETFKSVRLCMKKHSPFALIVGGNHTILGGKRFDIDTSSHLIEIATNFSWMHEETIKLQTYQRYGYHMNNAVNSESLIILRAI
jgi:SAM-dependent methyltransferase